MLVFYREQMLGIPATQKKVHGETKAVAWLRADVQGAKGGDGLEARAHRCGGHRSCYKSMSMINGQLRCIRIYIMC